MKSSLDCTHNECTHTEWCVVNAREVVAQFLRSARRDAKLAQREVAERSGMLTPAVGRLELGLYVPQRETVERFAKACGRPIPVHIIALVEDRAPNRGLFLRSVAS